jgi:probable F420-dependent oxidoreductase
VNDRPHLTCPPSEEAGVGDTVEGVKLGCGIPISGAWASPDAIVHVAQRAEELGYHSVWTFSRLLSDVDNALAPVYRSVYDPLITLGYVAAVTTRVRLGVAVVNLPFLSPALLAKQATTIDRLSHGRLDLGIGLGWSDDEYAASGANKRRVGRRAEEYVDVLRTLWIDDEPEHHGEFYEIPRSRQDPKPVQQPHPPILMGGTAPAALRRVGRIADGWISSSRTDLTTIGEMVDTIKAAAEQAGRDVNNLRFICRGVVRLQEAPLPDDDRPPLTGSAEQIKQDLAHLETQGITEVFADLNFDPRMGSPDVEPAQALALADATVEALRP